jgi:osmoprotectant transport system permease protein
VRGFLKTLVAIVLLALGTATGAQNVELKVGSKRFTESYILAEIVAQTARGTGEATVVHKPGLGNTAILFAALQSGAIDLYPEYTGTIVHELLGGKVGASLAEINRALLPLGLAAGIPLGFSNTYALAVAEKTAARLNLHRLSDLAHQPMLRVGLSQEFLNRRDGWPALKQNYGLPFLPQGLDHGLAYDALAAGQVDVIDIYTTDARIGRYALRVLADDRGFFPRYEALLLYRADLPRRLPATWSALSSLENRITPSRMIALNALVELDGAAFATAAQSFVSGGAGLPPKPVPRFFERLFGDDFVRITLEHLLLVFGALGLSCVAGIPLGIWAARSAAAHATVLPAVGVLQTIPALALLAVLIAVLDRIGTLPAIIALFLYGLLPIVRNTATGLAGVSRGLRQAGAALGLRSATVLRLIELPLAARTILAGIRTSAVINVGTATIAAFIGAGGYGERIVAGLAVNDRGMMLAGALPAAALALLIEAGFGLAERRLIPAGLRAVRRD